MKWGEYADYSYNAATNEIYVSEYNFIFKIFNNNSILALTTGKLSWSSFEFEDYNDGYIYMYCVKFDNNYSLKEKLSVYDDGTFTYFCAPYTSINGTYKYKDRVLKLNSTKLPAMYIADNTTYSAIWIKNYDTFWNNY